MSFKEPMLSFDKEAHYPITTNDAVKSISSGVSVNSEDTPITSDTQLGVLKTSCVSSGRFIPSENKTILASEFSRIKQPVESGTIIFSRMNTPLLVGEVGYVSSSHKNLFLPDRLWAIKTKSGYDPRWLANYLTTPKIKFRLKELATGTSGSMKNISQPSFLGIQLHSPKLEVQQKIADFLTSVDTKISQLTERQRLLKEYKKGVMQQIFSQQIRFKDENGNAFPDWEEKPLSQLASKITTKNKGRLVKAVLTNSAKYGIISQQDYFEKDIAKGDNTDNYCVVDINDFVYNPRISELAPVGPIGRNKIEQGVMSPLYSVFRFNSKVCLDFMEYFFKGTTWHKYMHSVANFGARHDRMNISSADLMALSCPCPCSDEQKKIARFLKTIDLKIEGVAEQIEQTKQFKKGLLQQMFV
ncbi:Type I restriction modification DNA specificity domain [Vibrio sp. B1FIG11]|uniref:restriction endonuclease subunit S n=1 Tax=Vibrio sp. B1FIG11 TaxID=2751177 RepID=UPI001AFAE49F|nr:restriction endonuclease subunit S [Vibrio sp. B1FIG11]CAD7797493.1 Type I restriction modification DNA specificity domain [Vibrio sp. B1FIG11]CAD7800805.1 Type I restriction modification DNA specificity domain [Vibrio sp. B1FIG11]CAD7801829.1 Type I restriction modification DNA specificity domain [Vibrio sp. B1FIG11]CAD7803178.1 Type I restriction modification DNA specificity domain [Vibrio sp. B1FIG11]CAE6880023.1 Type I restriction modification DNA specificity domain [Vibrio sp. B1FIG11]